MIEITEEEFEKLNDIYYKVSNLLFTIEDRKEDKDKKENGILIGSDGRCMCSCADTCVLGRSGMALRCTEGELISAGYKIKEK